MRFADRQQMQSETKPMPPFEAPAHEQTPTVLYVEDEPLNALLMQVLFEHRPNLRLVVANSGAAAHALAPLLRPSLLLLDLNLPDCNGAQLLNELREYRGWSDVAAIAVTADRDFDPAGTGFAEVWVKPFLLFHTLARLDEWLAPAAPIADVRPLRTRMLRPAA